LACIYNVGIEFKLWFFLKFDSDLIEADAKHTLIDVLTTLAVIVGWQFAALGYYCVDTLAAIIVAIIVLALAVKLMLRATPILVDASKYAPETIASEIKKVDLVDKVRKVRARNTRDGNYADIIISIDPKTSTLNAHHITEEIELIMKKQFNISDVVVHVEPTNP
jgi:cation diffusion facilitator family transporter